MEPDECLLLTSAGSRRDAGPEAVLRPRHSDRCVEGVRQSGEVDAAVFANVVGRMSFFVNTGMRFVNELAKMRAFVELWDEIARDRFGVQDPSKHASAPTRGGILSRKPWSTGCSRRRT